MILFNGILIHLDPDFRRDDTNQLQGAKSRIFNVIIYTGLGGQGQPSYR